MRRSFSLYLLLLAGSAAVYAQSVIGFGGVTGTIRDPYGEGLPDVTVTIHNEGLSVDRIVNSTDDGIFDAPALPPGPGYTIKLTRKGFVNWQSNTFEVLLGQTLTFEIGMQMQSSTAHIASQAPRPVDEAKTGASSLVTTRQVENLPTSARRADELVLLAPAVTADPATGEAVFRAEAFPKVTFLDGLDDTNRFYASGIPQTVTSVAQDAVGSLEIIEAAPPAEFGKTLGGMVNTVTKGGAQGWHGSAYGYFDDHQLNASDRYADGFKTDDRGHQLGGEAGGSLGSSFFLFANFQSDKEAAQGLNRIDNPLLAASNCKATTVQCLSVDNVINAQSNIVVPWSLSGMTGLVRMDLRPNESNNFSLEANALHRDSVNGANIAAEAPNGGLLGYNGNYSDENRFAKLSYTRTIGDNASNDARIGWFRDRFSELSDPKLLPPTNPTVALDVAGTQLGANPSFPAVLSEQRYQLVDNFSITKGKHSVKLGGEAGRNQDYLYQQQNTYGAFVYPSLTAFALDYAANLSQSKNYSSYDQTFGNLATDLRTMFFAGYLQDTWKALRRLTVVAGVRYEKLRIPQPSTPNTSFYQTSTIPAPVDDFAPRLGLSYLLTNRTVIRAGAGQYYQQYPGQLLDTLWGSNGYQTSITMNPNETGALVFPRRFLTSTSLPSGSVDVVYANSKLRSPYTEQATVEVERSLFAGLTLTASYLEVRGLKLWTATDLSLPATSTEETYTVEDANGNVTGTYQIPIWLAKNNNAGGRQYQINNEGQSEYRAAVAELRKSFSHGFSAQASYTWSRATDDVSGPPVLGLIPATVTPGDFVDDRGRSNFDQRQRGVVNWSWQPTLAKSHSQVARYLVNGWQLSTITTVASSLPETPLLLTVGQQFANLKVTMAYTNSINGSGGWSRAPFEPINSLSLGPRYTVNARLSRTLPFTQRLKGILMIEAFNAFDTQFNTAVNMIAYTATASVIRPVAGAGEPIQSWGLPFGSNARHFQISFQIVF
jgi:hypothetical protein